MLLNLLIKPVWLLAEMIVQDRVGHEDWGMYAGLLSFGFLFIALADLGINQYSTKALSSDPGLIRSYFPNLLTFKLIISLVYPFIMVGAGWLIGYSERELYFLLLLCLVHGGNQLMAFFRSNFQAMQRFKIDGFLSVFDRLLLLGLLGYLFYTTLSIERFIYIRLLTVAIGSVLFYGLIVRFYGWFKPKLKLPVVKKVLGMSLSFAMMTVLYSIHDKVDQVMLERLGGAQENGLYAGAYRWLDAFSMYLWTVLPIFFARFAYFIKDLKEQEKLLHFGQVIAALPMVFVSIFVFFYGEKLLFLFEQSSPAELATMRDCLNALFVAAFLNGIFAVFSTLLTSTDHEKFVNKLIILSILLNVILNWIFIPRYGAVASAWTTVASYAFIDIAYVVYIQLYISIRVPYLQMAKILLAGGIVAGVFWGLSLTVLPWYVNTLIAGLVFTGVSRLLGLISIEKLKALKV